MEDNKVWDLVELSKGIRTVGSKWIFRTKDYSKGNIEIYKVRLVAKGYTKKEGIRDAPTWYPVLGKGVTNLRTINLLTYIILNNYLENINLQKYFIYIYRSGIYSVLYIYYESYLLVLLHLHCL